MTPEVLVSVPDEMEAAAIVGALGEHGIRAQAVGGYTSGFRAEAPGMVKVIVGRGDLARATELLDEIHAGPGRVDWSTVDVGDRTPLSDEEKAAGEREEEGEATEPRPWRFQFSLATLLMVQTAVSVALALGRGIQVGMFTAVGLFAGTFLVLLAVMFVLIIAGTVVVASDLTGARAAWRYVGRALAVGLLTLAPLLLLLRILEGLGVRL
jgi:hypothetical protein